MSEAKSTTTRKLPTKNKEKIIFINGVFDIIHPGHILLLKFGKSLGGKLIVGINSDRVVKILKGAGRPINNQRDRKALLEALGLVDKVIIFDDLRIAKIIRKLKPDILVQGDEHTIKQIIEIDKIPENIKIRLFPRVSGFSTTNIVRKILGDK